GIGLYNLIALMPEVDEEFIQQSVTNSASFRKTLEAKREGITTEELIRRMAASGCYSIYLAVESANTESLYTSHKPTLNTNETYTQRIIKLLEGNGIRTTCGVMLGFINPNNQLFVETRKQIERTISYGGLLKETGATYINPFIFTPLPGAPHFSDLVEYVTPNTDEGFSHEFASMDAPNSEWSRDELNVLRTKALITTIGVTGYKHILQTGTWPVKR
ncbi:radical SAM protein, partial [Nanoarchaeota archaeon]